MDGRDFAHMIDGAIKGLFIAGLILGAGSVIVIGGIIWAICHWLV